VRAVRRLATRRLASALGGIGVLALVAALAAPAGVGGVGGTTGTGADASSRFAASAAPFVPVASAATAPSSAAKPRTEIARLLEASTVVIETFSALDSNGKPQGGTGSGFVIADERVVTNYHVVADAKIISLRLTGRTKTFRVYEIIDFDKTTDLAVLAVPGLRAPALEITNSNALEVGQDVFLLGIPLGEYDGTFSPGVVSNLLRRNDIIPRLQYTIPTSPGNSGGPVVDITGRVVGVHCAGDKKGQNINFAVPSDALLRFLKESGVSTKGRYVAERSAAPRKTLPKIDKGTPKNEEI
jgi:S1-C subfamily serine protease